MPETQLTEKMAKKLAKLVAQKLKDGTETWDNVRENVNSHMLCLIVEEFTKII